MKPCSSETFKQKAHIHSYQVVFIIAISAVFSLNKTDFNHITKKNVYNRKVSIVQHSLTAKWWAQGNSLVSMNWNAVI
jgi:hypothetical protein